MAMSGVPSETASSSHMSGMGGMENVGMTMVFFTATDTPLYSKAFTPKTTGQYAGICVFLIVLAVIFRGLIALRCNALTLWALWRRRQDTGILRLETDEFESKKASQRPWRINEAAAIAVLDMVLVGVSYLLMLAVMTMNVGYFMSILGGTFLALQYWHPHSPAPHSDHCVHPGTRWSHKPGMHAYLYFPTLAPWRPWENHPFSVKPTVMLPPSLYSGKTSEADASRSGSSDDVEKSKAVVPKVHEMPGDRPEVGLTFFVRKSVGITKKLQACNDLLTLVEGPYPNNSSEQVLRCDRLLLLAGGIGITAIVPFIANHWNVKLCWSVRHTARCLVDELEDVIRQVEEKDVRIGQRLDIAALIAAEAEAGWDKLGVVVAGPAQFCDDAWAIVSAEAKRCTSTEFALEVEAYSW